MDIAVLCVYYGALLVLAIYSVHRLHLVRLLRRAASPPTAREIDRWPHVTVQLPVFNEPQVVERLLAAAAALEYPGPLDIQLLDDSTDSTTALAADKIRSLVSCGVRIEHVRRLQRSGYKAGALAEGLEGTRAELVAVFDADFIPPPDFLRTVVPYFADPEVGMVQTRWSHLNRRASMLTAIQAIFLDGHFAVESAARYAGNRFFNFNGTAGVWRRKAIEDAGGWSASTLTEDLDLSYRAQLAGWKFVFLAGAHVPAELPASLSGFQDQQHRWAKGSLQTARKLLPTLLRTELPLRVKAEAVFHLTNNIAYLLTFMLALFIVPALLIRQRLGLQELIVLDIALFASSMLSIFAFYFEGQRRVGRKHPGLVTAAGVLLVGVGLSVRNASAVLEGMFQRGGFFLRTQKKGNATSCRAERKPRVPVAETILAMYFAAALAVFLFTGQWLGLPFLLLFLGGFGYVSILGFRERWDFARSMSPNLHTGNHFSLEFSGVTIAE